MIHRFWIGEPPKSAHWTARAIATSHGETPTDWTPATLPADCPTPDDPDPRHVSNVVRYWLLHRFGGLWLDHDVLPLTDLRCSYPYTAAIGLNRREGAVLWFPEPGHPMLTDLLAAVRDEGASPHRSGAHLLTEVGRRHGDVRREPAVLPHAADGTLICRRPPLAVHLWTSSRRNACR